MLLNGLRIPKNNENPSQHVPRYGASSTMEWGRRADASQFVTIYGIKKRTDCHLPIPNPMIVVSAASSNGELVIGNILPPPLPPGGLPPGELNERPVEE